MLTKTELILINTIFKLACKTKAVPFLFVPKANIILAKNSWKDTLYTWCLIVFLLIHNFVVIWHIYSVFITTDLNSIQSFANLLLTISCFIWTYFFLIALVMLGYTKVNFNQIQFTNIYYGEKYQTACHFKNASHLREKILVELISIFAAMSLATGLTNSMSEINLFWYYRYLVYFIPGWQGSFLWLMFALFEIYFGISSILICTLILLIGLVHVSTVTFWLRQIS